MHPRRPSAHRTCAAAVAALLPFALGGCKGSSPPAPIAAPGAALSAPAAAAPRVETSEYVVTLAPEVAQAAITITAKPPLHINPDYPVAFRPAGSSVTFDRPKVPLGQETKRPCAGAADETCESVSALKYSGGAPGAKVAGTLMFSVCQPEKCLIEKAPLAAVVP